MKQNFYMPFLKTKSIFLDNCLKDFGGFTLIKIQEGNK